LTGVNRYNIWAVGGLLGYEFGPVSLTVWALDEVSANASNGGGLVAPGAETITKGWTAFAAISYRLWAPETPVSTKNPLITK
jgi:hypothetical protein